MICVRIQSAAFYFRPLGTKPPVLSHIEPHDKDIVTIGLRDSFKRTTGMAPKRYQNVFARMDRSTSRKEDRASHSSNLRHTAVRKELHVR
jgi:hypothetical protein